jgi:Uma2 family endonuclease
MSQSVRFTSKDLEAFPDDGKHYEIIDGELYVSKAPSAFHQIACGSSFKVLDHWNDETRAGLVILGPGLIFAEDDDVIPDIIWISHRNLATALWPDGKLHHAPELVIEVLSPGTANEQRDRDAKLKLYGRRGVTEYWIINWQRREVEVYRRAELTLQPVGTLLDEDVLESPLLHGFSCPVRELFASLPALADTAS